MKALIGIFLMAFFILGCQQNEARYTQDYLNSKINIGDMQSSKDTTEEHYFLFQGEKYTGFAKSDHPAKKEFRVCKIENGLTSYNKAYDYNGKLKYAMHFKNGQRHGPQIIHFDSGSSKTEIYENGKITMQSFFSRGELTSQTHYVNGKSDKEIGFEQNRVLYIRFYNQQKKFQIEQWFNDLGDLTFERTFDKEGAMLSENSYSAVTSPSLRPADLSPN